MRKTLLLGTAALAMVGGLAVPAHAADTTTTFSLTSGALSITAPASASLGTGAIGTAVTASLGSVKANDARGSLTASWTATALSSAFTTGAKSDAETVAATNVQYWSGLATATTGTAVPTPGQLTALDATTVNTAKTAFLLAVGVGNNSATWSPTLIVNVPATAVAGEYSGTVTHSVA